MPPWTRASRTTLWPLFSLLAPHLAPPVEAFWAITGQQPDQAAADVTQVLADDAKSYIDAAVQAAATKTAKQIAFRASGPKRAVDEAVATELDADRQAAEAERGRQSQIVEALEKDVAEALTVAAPEVLQTANDFTENAVTYSLRRAESKALGSLRKVAASTDKVRSDATRATLVEQAASDKLGELTRNAESLAESLEKYNPEANAKDFLERTARAGDQAVQTHRIVSMAGGSIRRAEQIAEVALRRSLEAERDASEALDRATRNTKRIARLKLQAQDVYKMR